jgi:hypothetical protein
VVTGSSDPVLLDIENPLSRTKQLAGDHYSCGF